MNISQTFALLSFPTFTDLAFHMPSHFSSPSELLPCTDFMKLNLHSWILNLCVFSYVRERKPLFSEAAVVGFPYTDQHKHN